MPTGSKAPRRSRGEIETLPSGSHRVRVYAGIDPVSRKRHYLVETVPAGPTAAKQAEKVRTRLLNEVDEKLNPRTKATVDRGQAPSRPAALIVTAALRELGVSPAIAPPLSTGAGRHEGVLRLRRRAGVRGRRRQRGHDSLRIDHRGAGTLMIF
jgi:hypothetical protein